MRLIDADALPRHTQIKAVGDGQTFRTVKVVYAIDVDNAPTVEPKERVVAKAQFKIDIDEIVERLQKRLESRTPSGAYECFHCGTRSVIWDSDFDFSDFGYEGEGVVHVCHCANCGAEIDYRISIPEEEDEHASKEG